MKPILLFITLFTLSNVYAQFIEKPKNNCGGVKPDGLVSWCEKRSDGYFNDCACKWEKEMEKYQDQISIIKRDIDNKFHQIETLTSESEILYSKAIEIEKKLKNSENFQSDKSQAISNLEKSVSNYEKIISLTKQINLQNNRISLYRKDIDVKTKHTQIGFYKGIINRIKNIKKTTKVGNNYSNTKSNSNNNIQASNNSSVNLDTFNNNNHSSSNSNNSYNTQNVNTVSEKKVKYKTPEQINAVYDKFIQTNIQTDRQMSAGNFLGAANTYASAGRKTEAYAAAAGHVVMEVASVIQGMKKAKFQKIYNKLSNNLEFHAQKTNELIQCLEKNDETKFLELNSVLIDKEKEILEDADWLAYRDTSFENLIKEIFEKRLYRVGLVLKMNTRRIIVEPKNVDFAKKLMNLNRVELLYQIPYLRKRKLYDNTAAKFSELINDEQITRTKFLLELNKKDNLFNEETEMLIYLTSNIEDEELEKKSVETFKNLPKNRKSLALFYTVGYGIPDGIFFTFKNTYLYNGGLFKTYENLNKIKILLNDNKDFNYYMSINYSNGDSVPFYLYLKKSFSNLWNKYDKTIYNNLHEKVQKDELNFNLTKNALFEKYKDCSTLECNEEDDSLYKSQVKTIKENFNLMFNQYLIPVKGGSFKMGDTNGDGEDDEKPVHQVTVTDFSIGKTEVTVAMYRAYCTANGITMPYEPKWGWHDNDPIVNVSWNEAMAFCKWASSVTGKNITLPTEAQWEYAARGGVNSQAYKYSGSNSLSDVAWFDDNSNKKTHPVATKIPNELGLYDMSGNVWEWCFDYYKAKTYKKKYAQGTNPVISEKTLSEYKVFRGGSYSYEATYCRVASRDYDAPTGRHDSDGFRVVSF